MTQPDKPAPARGARPQLFGEPGSSKASKSRQPDFGPSILATIDGTPRRDSRSRDGTPLKRVLWMSLLALGVVAVYFAVKFGVLPSGSPAPAAPSVVVQAPAAAPSVRSVEPATSAPVVAQAASAASASEGVASIETVAAAAPSAAASTPAPNVAASLDTIQQVLARSEPTEPRKPSKAAAPKEAPTIVAKESTAVKERGAAERPASPPAKPSAKAANDDAELLAAMLPHLKRGGATPTSPAYEKRCGQLAGDAAVECRVKFCNGREGVDPACPSAVSR